MRFPPSTVGSRPVLERFRSCFKKPYFWDSWVYRPPVILSRQSFAPDFLALWLLHSVHTLSHGIPRALGVGSVLYLDQLCLGSEGQFSAFWTFVACWMVFFCCREASLMSGEIYSDCHWYVCYSVFKYKTFSIALRNTQTCVPTGREEEGKSCLEFRKFIDLSC